MSIFGYVKDLFVHPALYRKFWVALATAVLSAVSIAIPDSPYLPVVIQFAGVVGVFSVPNKKTGV